MKRARLQHTFWGIGLAISAVACAPIRPAPEGVGREKLSYVQDGRTTREEIVHRLGVPSGEFENGQVLTYRMGHGKHGTLVSVPRSFKETADGPGLWEDVDYSLVLVFDPAGTLERHRLLKVR